MSQYLSHLAALTLNQAEPVQPRLASRFEMPVDRGSSNHNDLDIAQESHVLAPAYVQPSTVRPTDSPVTHEIAAASADGQAGQDSSWQDQPKVVEHTKFMIKKSELPGAQQKSSSGPGFASVKTEQTSRTAQSINNPGAQATYEVRKDTPPTENLRTLVERVQEHFTETTHSEFVIREVTAPDANQKISKLEESPRPAPVKPASIIVQSGQSITGPNTPSRTGTDATPAPTIQVTIGRIEIRATQSADKPAAKPRAAGNTMSLNDYLKQRNGGKP